MRAQLAFFVVLAGAVAGCASTPPPPPPLAAVEPPPPPPAPVPAAPMAGLYRGSVEKTAESPARCRTLPATATARVMRNNTFTLAGARGRIAPDGTVSSVGRGPSTLTGTVSGNTFDVTTMRGGCGYHYTLTHS